jgi:hypothetical protein
LETFIFPLIIKTASTENNGSKIRTQTLAPYCKLGLVISGYNMGIKLVNIQKINKAIYKNRYIIELGNLGTKNKIVIRMMNRIDNKIEKLLNTSILPLKIASLFNGQRGWTID